MQARPDIVKPAASRPSDAMAMPSRIEWTRRIFATRCETQTTHRMIRKALALIIHSCAIIVPRGVWLVNRAGRCSARTIGEESTQSTMKLGSMSKSCMNISQKPDMMRMKAASRGWTRLRNVIAATRHTPQRCSPPAATSG